MDNVFYRQAIEQLAENKKNEQFFNSNAEHARIVLSTIFRYAEQTVDVYCGGVDSVVSGQQEYLDAMESFLKRNGKLRILFVEKEDDSTKDLPLRKLVDQFPGQVVMKLSGVRYCVKNKPIHFTVADQKSYRLETDIEKRMAFGNFNDPDWGEKLTNLFDEAFNSSAAKCLS